MKERFTGRAILHRIARREEKNPCPESDPPFVVPSNSGFIPPHLMHTTSNGYLLLFRGAGWHKELSPEEIQRVMGDWTSWFERLGKQDKLAAASPLENEGKIVAGKSRSVADAPLAESKETIGGFFLLKVDTMDEAVEIAQRCPALPYGLEVEVRPVAPACPASVMYEAALARATV